MTLKISAQDLELRRQPFHGLAHVRVTQSRHPIAAAGDPNNARLYYFCGLEVATVIRHRERHHSSTTALHNTKPSVTVALI